MDIPRHRAACSLPSSVFPAENVMLPSRPLTCPPGAVLRAECRASVDLVRRRYSTPPWPGLSSGQCRQGASGRGGLCGGCCGSGYRSFGSSVRQSKLEKLTSTEQTSGASLGGAGSLEAAVIPGRRGKGELLAGLRGGTVRSS